jgi:hypothetical protein
MEADLSVAGGRDLMNRLALAGLLLLAACANAPRNAPKGPEGTPKAGWLLDSATSRCVEEVSEVTLARRSWAFDGTIERVAVPDDPESQAPTEVVFAVNRWYKGGSGSTVTVKTYSRPGSVDSVGGPDPSIGARILASGEDVYLWSCGFSVPYTAENAELFARVFGDS